MSQFDAVVFDMDGVLVNSAPSHRAAFEQVFEPLGIRDFIYSDYAGQRTAEVVEAVLRHASIEPTRALVSQLAETKSRLAREHLRATNPIAACCLATLRKLTSHYTLALASSGSRSSVDLFLRLNDCAGLFRSVLSGNDVQHAKPHPEIYERSFRALGIESGKAVVIEDAVSGILAARAAHAGAVIGITGTCPPGQLSAAGADTILQNLGELPAILGATG